MCSRYWENKYYYVIFQLQRSLWKSTVAITSSATGGEGPEGGQETRNPRNLLHRSTLYMHAERLGRSTKLHWTTIEFWLKLLLEKNCTNLPKSDTCPEVFSLDSFLKVFKTWYKSFSKKVEVPLIIFQNIIPLREQGTYRISMEAYKWL